MVDFEICTYLVETSRTADRNEARVMHRSRFDTYVYAYIHIHPHTIALTFIYVQYIQYALILRKKRTFRRDRFPEPLLFEAYAACS